MGQLIVIEGACDGIGKSTQYNMLFEHLKKEQLNVHNHHFPSYGTYQSVGIEKYLSGDYGLPSELSPYFVHLLYANDRAVTWYEYLKEIYEHNNTILLDRYTTSSIIYQTALIEDIEEKIKFIEYIINFEYKELGIKEPDNVIFLHAAFELVTAIRCRRKENEGVEKDIHEMDLEFLKKVYDNAMFVADYLSWNKVKCDDGKNMRSVDDIHNDIFKLVKKI